jgi:hypothetical protein
MMVEGVSGRHLVLMIWGRNKAKTGLEEDVELNRKVRRLPGSAKM